MRVSRLYSHAYLLFVIVCLTRLLTPQWVREDNDVRILDSVQFEILREVVAEEKYQELCRHMG